MADWPFVGLGRGKYAVVLADPPWHFRTRSVKGQGKSPGRHYKTMSPQQIMALPVAELCRPDAVLFLWGCNPMVPLTLRVIDAWGFEFRAVAFTWAKRPRARNSPTGRRRKHKWHFGPGYYTRQNTERCYIGVRGHPRRLNADVPELIEAPVREHSRKPDEQYALIERLLAGPYCELFSRQEIGFRKGWDIFGDQVGKFKNGGD